MIGPADTDGGAGGGQKKRRRRTETTFSPALIRSICDRLQECGVGPIWKRPDGIDLMRRIAFELSRGRTWLLWEDGNVVRVLFTKGK